MPYVANQEDFQLTNMLFEKYGRYYRAVKQRYHNDTFQLNIVVDLERKVLQNAIQKWISSLNNNEPQQDQNGKIVHKSFVNDYLKPEKSALEFSFNIEGIDTPESISSRYENVFFHLDIPPPLIG